MAQLVVSWIICDGRLRVHAINALGRRSGRIIEIEDIAQASASMALPEDWSDWCRRFEAPVASWTESRQGHSTRPLEA
jgi:hypothetical protein